MSHDTTSIVSFCASHRTGGAMASSKAVNRLVAMAGRRLRPPGFVEVSAVCTHPDARRRGYASIVTADVARGIDAEGDTPMIHVATTNHSALTVYEQLGFTTRRVVSFGAYQVPRPEP